jgi:hypothetical protein
MATSLHSVYGVSGKMGDPTMMHSRDRRDRRDPQAIGEEIKRILDRPLKRRPRASTVADRVLATWPQDVAVRYAPGPESNGATPRSGAA